MALYGLVTLDDSGRRFGYTNYQTFDYHEEVMEWRDTTQLWRAG